MHSSVWTLRNNFATSQPGGNHAVTQTQSDAYYERRLGPTEEYFYLGSSFSRTSDSAQTAEIEVEEENSRRLVDIGVVKKTWLGLKQQFPLLGASLDDRGDKGVYFIVKQNRLRECLPEEVVYREIDSADEAYAFATDLINVGEWLSNSLLARLFVLRRRDRVGYYHIIFHAAHYIIDGTANLIFLRSFLDRLSSLLDPTHEHVPVQWDLEERLALSIPSESLMPSSHLSVARQRWRKAIAATMLSNRMKHLAGGHTLPRHITPLTPITPAQSKALSFAFSDDESAAILYHCRRNGITFGHALTAISQVAVTRILCRRYVSGRMDKDEWEFRKREPMNMTGPLSLRPFLRREWLERRGAENICLAIGFFNITMPFMPLGSAVNLQVGDPVPTYDQLLSPGGRFLLRCSIAGKQMTKYLNHPLFLEINAARLPSLMLPRARGLLHELQKSRSGEQSAGSQGLSTLPAIEQARTGPVVTNGGASFGNSDHLVPLKFPRNSGQKPLVTLHANKVLLHCRPGELYLGAGSRFGHLGYVVFWDGKVYEDEIIKEWMDEITGATLFYLGGGQIPRSHL